MGHQLAQSVEQSPFNLEGVGSNPGGVKLVLGLDLN